MGTLFNNTEWGDLKPSVPQDLREKVARARKKARGMAEKLDLEEGEAMIFRASKVQQSEDYDDPLVLCDAWQKYDPETMQATTPIEREDRKVPSFVVSRAKKQVEGGLKEGIVYSAEFREEVPTRKGHPFKVVAIVEGFEFLAFEGA